MCPHLEDVQLLDLMLTTAARMLVLTGDVSHRDNYFMKIEPLEEIHELLSQGRLDFAIACKPFLQDALRGIELKAPEIASRCLGSESWFRGFSGSE